MGTRIKSVFVYFVQQETGGPIKIGLTDNPSRRFNQLQRSSPNPLKMLGVCKGGIAAERRLHRLFDEDRLHAEWFNPSTRLLNLIARCPSWESVADGGYCPEIVDSFTAIITDLYLAGYQTVDIAEVTELSKQRVYQILHKTPRLIGRYNKSKRPIPNMPIRDVYTSLCETHSEFDFIPE